MKYLLGIVAIVCCLVISTFDAFLDNPLKNFAYWGVAISIVYMVLSNLKESASSQS